jgi:hypothetical protein
MASFTETVEKRNPALTATGLAVWGWIIRAVVSISIFILPYVVTTMTPLFENGPTAQSILASDPIARTVAAHPTLFNQLNKYATCPPNPAAVPPALLQTAIREVGIGELTTVATAQCNNPTVRSNLAFLNAHGTQVQNALNAAPREWRTWWWVCVGCEVAFLPFIFVMAGRWSPRRARRDEREHQELVDRELAALPAEGGVTPAQA